MTETKKQYKLVLDGVDLVPQERVKEEDCECGNNRHKGYDPNGDMRCEDCDIDGINYNGGLTDDDDEFPADHPAWTGKWCDGCKSYNIKGKWIGCENCDKCWLDDDDDDVCCVGCGERVCGFTEEPPHKDRKGEAICDDCLIDEKPMPFDSYKTLGGIEIMSFHTDESHHIEDIIFNYYDKNKYSLKHKSDTYFLLIDDQPRKSTSPD